MLFLSCILLTGKIRNCLITFSYKDYKHGDVKKEMSLKPIEFIRRFSMHIMPRGFVRIRHFGILSSTGKKKPKRCPHCKTETMINLEILPKRGPPSHAALMETVRMEKIAEMTTWRSYA
jgi:hypothetical protein